MASASMVLGTCTEPGCDIVQETSATVCNY